MTGKPECADCRQTMDEGFIIDRGHGDMKNPGEWMEGKPEKSFWAGVKSKGKERHVITSWRCPRCGLLRMYAKEE